MKINKIETSKYANILTDTDFGYQLGKITGKYLPAAMIGSTALGGINLLNAYTTEVDGETDKERRSRLIKAALVPTVMGLLTSGAGALAGAAWNTNRYGLKKSTPFSEQFSNGFSYPDDSGAKNSSPPENNTAPYVPSIYDKYVDPFLGNAWKAGAATALIGAPVDYYIFRKPGFNWKLVPTPSELNKIDAAYKKDIKAFISRNKAKLNAYKKAPFYKKPFINPRWSREYRDLKTLHKMNLDPLKGVRRGAILKSLGRGGFAAGALIGTIAGLSGIYNANTK